MSINFDASYPTNAAPASTETDPDDWGEKATWAETIATVVVTVVALVFVSLLAVVMGLA
jgi:hypothetical protein